MILEALVSQFVQRFQHEKRAQVCLWFDERREFARLLPALSAHLREIKEAPFYLFEYDANPGHGQVWLKYQIYRSLEAANPDLRRQMRFVLYLPLSEELLDHGVANGKPQLDLLDEYRISGITWRIDGKRPTLFTFLRRAGIALPNNPSEQRRLYDGGRDSLLAKYVEKFIDRPAVFWATQLTPEIAQSRLIGDVDQTILDIAVDPDATWRSLEERGLLGEFLALVREQYRFEGPADSPADWIRDFVMVLALTETYMGYHEPSDFPFAQRLPPWILRPHHIRFLLRWLRDSESRPAWDGWIAEVETKLNLTAWAKGRQGVSLGFPHLIRLRWNQVWSAFEEASAKESATAKFFEDYRELIRKEAEYARVSRNSIGAWDLLGNTDVFVKACEDGLKRAECADRLADLARTYADCASTIEGQHIRIRYDAEEQGLPTITRVADRAYARYTNMLNTRFFQHLAESGSAAIQGFESVTPRLEQTLWKARGKRAVIIVDALRYDCAIAIQGLLREQQVDVEPLVAMLPTVTSVGMTALLPLSAATIGLQLKNNNVHPIVNGKDTFLRANRLAFLTEFGADCREVSDIESLSAPPVSLGSLLVVFGHEEVDGIGHNDAQTLIRHVHLEIERLVRLIRKLHRWSYPDVHVVTDHGFTLLDEEKLPEEVHCERDWCHVYKERFALVPAKADLPLTTFPFAWDPSIRVAVPPGLAFFKAEKSFSHGGASLQELIIPHLISRVRALQRKRIGVEVVLPTYELLRTAVKVVLRPVADNAGVAQMDLFAGTGRALVLDVTRIELGGGRKSVLAAEPREIRLEPTEKEQTVTLFFHTAATFHKGELLDLDIRDVETGEQFPPGGIKLTVGRDM